MKTATKVPKNSKVRVFLAAIRVCPSVRRAAAAADIDRGVHYRRNKVDPAYKAAFDEAWEMGVQTLEDVAAERAQLGWEEPVVFQGKFSYPVTRGEGGRMRRSTQPLTVTKFSDSLLQFMLRGAKPEKFRERWSGEITGKDGGPLSIQVTFVKASES